MRYALSLIIIALAASAAQASDLRFFDDASLHDVQFYDKKEGWAVGDEGVILHTVDGGGTWERQKTGVRASLRSVHFLNPYLGWVAGREELANGATVGMLLFTRDGGLKWHRLLPNSLPGLNFVRFFGSKVGYVVGDGSDQFASGVFKTTDSGKTWEPVKGTRASTWLTGAFQDRDKFLLGGAWSRLAYLQNGTFSVADVEKLGTRSLLDMHVLRTQTIAVGQGGLVLTSQSYGKRWGFAKLNLPQEVLAACDFHSVHAVGPDIWIVGRPGSVILHSGDSGKSWTLRKTGHNLPRHGVYFHSQQLGWAVGDCGCVLQTIDGGKTWRRQRGRGKRSAVLFVHSGAETLPVDSASVLGIDGGYLTASLRVAAPDPKSTSMRQATAQMRFAQGFRIAGGTAGEMLWQFPLPHHLTNASKKQILDYWNQIHDGRSAQELLRQLVLAIRLWRPNVIITEHPSLEVTKRGKDAIVAAAIHQAANMAAEADAFPEQLSKLHLKPWEVARIYGLWHSRDDAQVTIDNTRVRNQLRAAAQDFAGPAASILVGSMSLPSQRYYRLFGETTSAKQTRLLDGIVVGDEARREPIKLAKLDKSAIEAARQRRFLQMLTRDLKQPSKTLALIGTTLDKLPDDQAPLAAYAIATEYARKGEWSLAREAFVLMVNRYPTHPRSADAYRWLVQHISSSEARRRHELGQFVLVSTSSVTQSIVDPKIKQASGSDSKLPRTKTQTDTQGSLTYLRNPQELKHWYRGSLKLGERLVEYGPIYGFDPAVQFCLQSSRRKLGKLKEVNDWYKKFHDYFPAGVWHDAAAAELWMANRAKRPGKIIASCRLTATRPYLDGKLDDPCWKGRAPMILKDVVDTDNNKETAAQHTTQAWFAYDKDCLYIAVRCTHPAGQQVPRVRKRKRDDDLRKYDRVSILLDLDRDYSTYFHLQVDQRGCVREDCWGDVTWNPRWFVAAQSDETSWQVEAALPLSELTADQITVNSAWACNVTRILPGRAVHSWSRPADVKPRPEGMGLLVFTKAPSSKSR